jgi:predicted N-acyltransferase
VSDPLRVEVRPSIFDVGEGAWDALLAADGGGGDNPFVTHAFLAALERSGSVGGRSGWTPRYLLVWSGASLVAAAPGWLKAHSQGEYIFDWSWADAAWRAGLPYYPKLVLAVPFTPATGPRLLLDPAWPREALVRALDAGVRAVVADDGALSAHGLFLEGEDEASLVAAGYLPRRSMQYHWLADPAWRSGEDWLAALTQKRRKEVRRERAQARAHGLDIKVEPGDALSASDVEACWRCYRATVDAHGATPYLTRAWFDLLRTDLASLVRVATARESGEIVAMALAFQRGRHLYGRYWGALRPLRAMHFELCYYQLIDHALATGVTRLEAGAQGEHKIARGFLPAITRSVHRLEHPGLHAAVAQFLVREAERVEEVVELLDDRSPYATPPRG